MARPPKAFAAAAFGARGTGKTVWCKRVVQAYATHPGARVLVWDYKHDHDLAELGQGFTSWPAFVGATKAAAYVVRYLPSPDHDPHEQFAAWCELAWREGNLLMFVDELPEVTKANRAPAEWRRCVNVGRSYANGTKSLSILAAGQRPTEVDKSFLGNCDVIHTGRLGFEDDARMFGRMWGVPSSELATLPDLHWIEKRASSPGVERGVLTFPGNSPAAPAKPRRRAPKDMS